MSINRYKRAEAKLPIHLLAVCSIAYPRAELQLAKANPAKSIVMTTHRQVDDSPTEERNGSQNKTQEHQGANKSLACQLRRHIESSVSAVPGCGGVAKVRVGWTGPNPSAARPNSRASGPADTPIGVVLRMGSKLRPPFAGGNHNRAG